MEVMEFLHSVREAVMPILVHIEKGERSEAFSEYRKNIGAVNGFVIFLEENSVIAQEDLRQMLTNLVQAIEQEDLFLLEDILRYAVLDIIEQLEGSDEQ